MKNTVGFASENNGLWGTDTWPSVVRLNINSICKFNCMRRWLNRDVLVAVNAVGWVFDMRDYDDRVLVSLKSFFFFFPNRLVAAAPGR